MRYTRLELRLLPRGWSRGTLYLGPVGGKVRGALLDPARRVVTHTLASQSKRQPLGVDPARAVGDERTPLPTGHVRLTAGMRLRAGTGAVGRVDALWVDRASAALTHLVVRPRGGPLGRERERILPIELVETFEEGGVLLSKGALPLDDLPLFRPDLAIEHDVRLALVEAIPDPQARRAIKVRVEDGHVSLVGAVDAPETVEAAARAVAAAAGVRGVTLDLLSLETLADRVEQHIARTLAEHAITGASVRVLTEHAIVYLEGTAPSTNARLLIESAALGVAGARVVVNDIAVGGQTPSRATETGPLVRNR